MVVTEIILNEYNACSNLDYSNMIVVWIYTGDRISYVIEH